MYQHGVHVLVVAEAGVQLPEIPETHIIRIGGAATTFQKVIGFIKAMCSPFAYIKLMATRTELGITQRLIWAAKYLPLVRIRNVDIIHFQWLPLLAEFAWLRHYYTCPFVGSARGSQVTIYPITRPGYKQKIQASIVLADYIHCVSKDIVAACERLGAPREKLFVNYNGIDLQKFKPQIDKDEHSIFTIISVGALMWRKGYVYQLLAIKKLVASGKEVLLRIIGSGVDSEALVYTANVLGLKQYVEFVGQKNEDELQAVLATGNMYMSTSAAEGLANSVVEAMASGLPVVVFDCEGMNELIENSNNGFVVPFGDTDKLVEQITFLMEHAEKRRVMGEHARAFVEAKLDQTVWVQHMIVQYEGFKRG